MVVLGRVHSDGDPAMGLVRTRMHDVRFAIVIRTASGINTRCNNKRGGRTQHQRRQLAHGDQSLG